jgi:aerobic-type carbon monoxide dehydrogenase small subunit (CoxS/CutS family)
MSVTSRKILRACKDCGGYLTEFHMKNPFIDDTAEECSHCEPGEALAKLQYIARTVAKEDNDDHE